MALVVYILVFLGTLSTISAGPFDDDEDDIFKTHREHTRTVMVSGTIASVVIASIIIICCFVCPFCCLYKLCRKPRPVVATTTHTTTVVTTPYPQNASPAQQYPGYQPVVQQPGYGTPAGYGGQPMPSAPYQGHPYALGPPPAYQDIAGPGYPMNYSQAAFTPGQQPYPLQPPAPAPAPAPAGYSAQPPPRPADLSAAQPAYNPDYVPPPSRNAY